MLVGEVYAGEDAEVLVEAIKADYSGEDEDSIANLAVYVKWYKEAAVHAIGATAVWDSDMGQYLVTIPAAYVPASGIFDAVVRGSGDISDVLIRLQVNTADTAIAAIKAKTDTIDWSMIKEALIMEIGNYDIPTGGGAGSYTITLSEVGNAEFTVDEAGNRTLTSITMV